MRTRWLGACLVFLALLAGVSGFGLALRGNVIAQNNSDELKGLVLDVQTLLLNGKTASAKSAKKTAQEVATLLKVQAYEHSQTVAQLKAQARGPAELAAIIREIERHIDKTVGRDVHAQANRILRRFGK